MFQVTSGELLVCVGGNHCSSALDSGWWSMWFTNILLHYIDYNKNTSYTYLIYIYIHVWNANIYLYILYHITVYRLLDSHIYHYISYIYVFSCDIHLLAPCRMAPMAPLAVRWWPPCRCLSAMKPHWCPGRVEWLGMCPFWKQKPLSDITTVWLFCFEFVTLFVTLLGGRKNVDVRCHDERMHLAAKVHCNVSKVVEAGPGSFVSSTTLEHTSLFCGVFTAASPQSSFKINEIHVNILEHTNLYRLRRDVMSFFQIFRFLVSSILRILPWFTTGHSVPLKCSAFWGPVTSMEEVERRWWSRKKWLGD